MSDVRGQRSEVRLIMEQTRQIGRRRFLVMCGRIILGVIAVAVVPVEIGFSKDSPAIRKRFVIKIKPFKNSDLYKTHNLAG